MKITFCGHREIDGAPALPLLLEQCLRAQLSAGATEFFFGGYGAFQALALQKVLALRGQYPAIHTALVLPYLCVKQIPPCYDEIIYPPLEKVPWRLAILKRDEWLVEHCDLMIAYVTHEWGGAAKMMRFAERKKKRIISLVE